MMALLPALAVAAAQEEAADEIVVEAHGGVDAGSATVVEITPIWSAQADVAEVLSGVAGATVRRLGPPGTLAFVGLRGSSARQVSVHLDGLPLNPDGSDAFDLSELPLTLLREVHVYRGFAPAWYGAAGMGGVIDLRTPRAEAAPLSVRASLGSFRTFGVAGSGGWAWKRGDAYLASDLFGTRGDARYFDDAGTAFDDGDDAFRTRANADQRRLSTFARTRFGTDRLAVTLVDHLLLREQGLPGPIGAPALEARFGTVRNLASVSLDGAVGGTTLHGRVWHQYRQETLDDRASELGVGTRWQQDVTHVVGGSFRAQAAPTSWLSLTGVLHGRWEQAVRTPLTTEIPETQLQRGVVAGTLGAGFHPLDGALTVEPVVDIRWLGSTQDVFGASPRVALAGRVHPDVTLRTQGGRYFRPPSVFELQGDRGDRQGNPTLSPERGWQADVGVDWTPQLGPVALQVSATGLFNEATDLIVWIQNAQRTTIPVNLGRARIFGVEGAFRIDVGDWVQGRTALTWLDARNRTEASVLGNQIPNVPRWQVDQRVLFVPTPWLQFGWDGHVVDGTFLDATNILGVPTRVLHGLTLRLRPVDVGPTLEVRVSNVGDRLRQQVPADPLVGEASGLVWQPVVDFVGYPLAGRTVMVTLSWTGR